MTNSEDQPMPIDGDSESSRESSSTFGGIDDAARLETAAFLHRPPSRPERIGPYRILEEIGHGGMGVVYLAQRTEPFRQRVALKLIKLGMDTREVVARFESERQALALMKHPNVAAVYDAGAAPDGRPYFVMEYVPGEPITTYCDKHRLSIPERLDLFMQVCNAVQHAHQKAIIHRDIKPSNILVTAATEPRSHEATKGREKNVGRASHAAHGVGRAPHAAHSVGRASHAAAVAKVIDFGVAKAVNQRLTEHTVYTQQGMLIGTPEYMSPEQAEMTQADIDTRTDIYSLGVLLYELLTGTLPFDPATLRSAGYAAIQRIIREVEPPKPSTRLSSLSDVATKPRSDEGVGQASPDEHGGHDSPVEHGAGLSPHAEHGVGRAPHAASTLPLAKGNPVNPPLAKGELSEIDAPPLAKGGFGGVSTTANVLHPEPHKPSELLKPRSDNPRTASTLADIAHQRQSDPKSLLRTVRGDLDWIVMRALEKDRTRRYDTANGLALEIQRYLNNEPVLAGPPSMGYRITKFVQRNRSLVIMGGICFFLVLSLITISMYAVIRQDYNDKRWRRRNLHSLVEKIPSRNSNSSDFVAAEPFLYEALELDRQLEGNDSVYVAKSLIELIRYLQEKGDPASAIPMAREALSIFERSGHETSVMGCKIILASLLHETGQYHEVERLCRDSLIAANEREYLRRYIPHLTYRLARSLARMAFFQNAEALILNALEAEQANNTVDRVITQQLIEAILDIYDAWHVAEPEKGYDAKAAEWRGKLDEWQATTQLATEKARENQLP